MDVSEIALPQMTDECRMIVDTVRRFVREKVQPLEAETEETGVVPPDRLAALKAEALSLNLYAMNMPTDVGGGGLSTHDMCLVEEQFGQTSDALIRRIFGQVYPMLMACTPAQRETYLIPTVRGAKICSMGHHRTRRRIRRRGDLHHGAAHARRMGAERYQALYQ